MEPAGAVLVTGAAGYVGSVCSEMLVQEGVSVIAYDDLSEGHREAVHPEATFVRGDVGNRRELDRVFSEFRIHAVMHFAATAIIDESDPGQFFRNNVCALQALLDSMLAHKVTDLVFSSSAAVYGEALEIPIGEDHPKSPVNSYGDSKWMGERILHWHHRSRGVNYVALRYFNAAGASEHYGEDRRCETHILPLLLQAAAGERSSFTIHGADYPTKDGTCIRDYVHVLDIAQAHVLALRNLRSVGAAAYNIGSGDGFSVREVVDTVQSIVGKVIPIQTGPRRPGDPAVLLANPQRIQTELRWRPAYSNLREIISSAWKWKQAHPKGYGPPQNPTCGAVTPVPIEQP